MQGQVDPTPQEGTGAFPPRMQGFGSADITTPLHYGSVNDGRIRMDGLEQKLKKQYWKTKQTFIQKLGKDQDEYVIAGDTEIDMKLEKAYHLRSTSIALLQAISKYSSRLKSLSQQEEAMGRFLTNWSETEYTNAGEVMKNVGRLQESDSQARLGIIPALARIQSECAVFQSTAIRDLNFSIQRLEKARTDYRAALLWMKNVSEKLQNPDYYNQLAKFREAQAAVKDSKAHFEKLKVDLSEKIDMVFASRCNLLSRSLPYYQKEVLSFFDNSANSFHKILVDLRSHHHHQYKVKRLLEEIRDLESEETLFTELTRTEDGDDDVPMLNIEADPVDRSASALSSSSSRGVSEVGENVAHFQDGDLLPPRDSDPFSLEKIDDEVRVDDLILGGAGVDIQSLQSEMMQPNLDTAQPMNAGESNQQPSQTSIDDIDNLLNMDDTVVDEASKPQPSQDEVLDEWSSFSAFMSTSRDDSLKEFMTTTPAEPSVSSASVSKVNSGDLTPSLQPLITQAGDSSTTTTVQESAPTTSEKPQSPSQENGTNKSAPPNKDSSLLMDDLKSLGLESPERKAAPVNPSPYAQSGLESLDPHLFQQQSSLPFPSQHNPPLPPLRMSHPPLVPPGQYPVPGQVPVFRSPMAGSQMPIFPPMYPVHGAPPTNNLAGSGSSFKAGKQSEEKEEQEKGTAWMNVFAHLDPLVNEKV